MQNAVGKEFRVRKAPHLKVGEGWEEGWEGWGTRERERERGRERGRERERAVCEIVPPQQL